jgi:alpha-mannosidase
MLDTLYVIHHSHTDIGFTHDQPIFWDLQTRFIDEALHLIEKYAEKHPFDSAFRWTVETTCGLEAWLKTARASDIDRLVWAEKNGYLEVTAMFANITPLLDIPQLIESLRPVQKLRAEFGFDIRYAMNCDVNGQNWTLADVLLDAGIEGFSMAINHHFGGPPDPRPNVFLWQAPSGRTLPAHNGWQYSKAADFGLGDDTDERFTEWLPRIESYLDEIHYPLPFIMLEGFHPFGDNGSAWTAYAEFARRWNESGRAPRIVTATPRMFWERAKNHHAALNVLLGDWTDYWNFGCISAARETTIARSVRQRLYRADVIRALSPRLLGEAAGAELAPAVTGVRARDEAWRNLILYGEHTWGADSATNQPEIEDSRSMDNHKKHFAYQARSLSLMLERDALADLTRHVTRNDPDELLIVNPLPWSRTISGPISRYSIIPRGLPDDVTSGRLFQDRFTRSTDLWTNNENREYNGGMGWWLPPTQVPAMGYALMSTSDLASLQEAEVDEDTTIENHRYRLTFDLDRGGISSLYDKQLDREWIDRTTEYPLHGFVHEEVDDHDHEWPRKLLFDMDWAPTPETERGWKPAWPARRTGPTKVLWHKVYRLPFATIVEQMLEHPHVGQLCQRVLLPHDADHIECQSEWQMGLTAHPEATYLLFPFDLPHAQARFDVGGVPVRPHSDQLPGVCRDYFTVQGWVDFNNGDHGVTIAAPDNPMIQLGDFSFAQNRSDFTLDRALLLGWVTNNYWETNFPAYQPGTVTARYHILPYAGEFDEARAQRFAAEAAQARPLVQHMGEAPLSQVLPSSGKLLHLPEPPIVVMSLARVADGMTLTLFNASGKDQSAVIRSALLTVQQAWQCDLFGQPAQELSVIDQGIEVTIEARRLLTLKITAMLLVSAHVIPTQAGIQ